ncbi:hypothetical protein [Dysgonomonas termitidis]|uniref:Uncharacterized protein n=1 Tax=Dysgonomonas termitidis TaxID=1516126 RepID=A0ABV9KSB5_9BACT
MKQTLNTSVSKKATFKLMLLILVILSLSQTANAQVTVGLGEEPEQYATLQIKDLDKNSTTSVIMRLIF